MDWEIDRTHLFDVKARSLGLIGDINEQWNKTIEWKIGPIYKALDLKATAVT